MDSCIHLAQTQFTSTSSSMAASGSACRLLYCALRDHILLLLKVTPPGIAWTLLAYRHNMTAAPLANHLQVGDIGIAALTSCQVESSRALASSPGFPALALVDLRVGADKRVELNSSCLGSPPGALPPARTPGPLRRLSQGIPHLMRSAKSQHPPPPPAAAAPPAAAPSTARNIN